MKTMTRTVYGSALQAAKYLGIPHVIVPKTTLNEKFNIQQTMMPNPGETPANNLYVIGNGGHRVIIGAGEIPYTDPIDHDASHAALYKHLPFVVRFAENDLTLEQRKMYGLREEMVLESRKCFVYWAKWLNVKDTKVAMEKTVDGVTVPFIPNTDNLNPTPPSIPNTGTTQTTNAYLAVSAPVTIEFTAFDVAELQNACKIMFGNEQLAIVSELGIVSSIPRPVTIKTTGGASVQFTEAVCAQVGAIISAYHNTSENSEGFIKELELGEAEPLITGLRQNVMRAPLAPVGAI